LGIYVDHLTFGCRFDVSQRFHLSGGGGVFGRFLEKWIVSEFIGG